MSSATVAPLSIAADAVDRLPPVADEAFFEQCQPAAAPAWLKPLNLPTPRTDLRCLRLRTRLVKRVVDISVASVLLLVTAPLLVMAAVAIKFSSPGPLIFTQVRVGLNTRRERAAGLAAAGTNCRRKQANYGKPFKIYKLRTMHVQTAAGGPRQAQPGDCRVFPVGRLLRRMRIDELPQLVNVLRGEMSMVGPRPECIEYMDELSRKVPGYLNRLGLKPGLTGIAQIEAGYANDLPSYRRKVAYDLLYLQSCSLWNDLRIMRRTVRVVLSGFGAL